MSLLHQEPPKSETPSKELPRDQRVGREISFGIQQTLACWATDFIDPVVGRWFQNRHGNKEHHVTHTHTWGAEAIGDTGAFFAYMAIKRLFTKPVDAITGGVKRALDPIYGKLGKKTLERWRVDNHLDQDSPRYQQRLDRYKNFQAEMLVDSAIIAASSTAINVLAQQKLGNRQTKMVIFKGKIIGAVATMVAVLGARTAAPDSMRMLDHELSTRYFSKVSRGLRRIFGVAGEPVEKVEEVKEPFLPMISLQHGPVVPSLPAGHKLQGWVEGLRRGFGNRDLKEFPFFVEQQKQIYKAFIAALDPSGELAHVLARRHYEALESIRTTGETRMEKRLVEKSAVTAIQSILLNRRDDVAGYIAQLEDPAFLETLKARFAAPAKPKVRSWRLPEGKKEELIESLVQTRAGGEPAVHIFANAKGQIIEHDALAYAFAADGDAAPTLAQDLQKHLPPMPPGEVQAIAEEYMADRYHAAKVASHNLKLDGEVVNEAIRRSESLRTHKDGFSHVQSLQGRDGAQEKTATI